MALSPAKIGALLIFAVPATLQAGEPSPLSLGPQCEAVDVGAYAQVRYVDAAGGSDTGGDGTRDKPWATPGHALAQIADAGPERRYAVFVASGVYTVAGLRMKPHVDLYGGFHPAREWVRGKASAHASVLDARQLDRVITGSDQARLDGFTLTGGASRGHGGAILCDGVSPIIANNLIKGNVAQEPEGFRHDLIHQLGNEGGAIACVNGAKPMILRNRITGNTTQVGAGGAIVCRNQSSPVIEGNVILGNASGVGDLKRTRSSNGGGIACSLGSSPVIRNNLIVGNRVGGNSDAGGIYLEYDSSPVIEGNWILANAAEDDGGAIYVMKSSEPLIDGNFFAGNTDKGRPAAIRLSKEGRAWITNNVFYDAGAGGAMVSIVDSWMALTNNTFVTRRAAAGAQVVYSNRTPHMKLPMIANNIAHAEDGGAAPLFAVDNAPEAPAAVSCWVSGPQSRDADRLFKKDGVAGTAAGIDRMLEPPTFQTAIRVAGGGLAPGALAGRVIHLGDAWGVVAANDAESLTVWGNMDVEPGPFEILSTFHLQAGSPCVDGGAPAGAPPQDFDGDPRPQGKGIDIGADEYRAPEPR